MGGVGIKVKDVEGNWWNIKIDGKKFVLVKAAIKNGEPEFRY